MNSTEKLTFLNFWRHPRFYRHALFIVTIASFFLSTIIGVQKQQELRTPIGFDIIHLAFALIMIYGSFAAFNLLFKKRKYFLFAIIQFVIIGLMLLEASNTELFRNLFDFDWKAYDLALCDCTEAELSESTDAGSKKFRLVELLGLTTFLILGYISKLGYAALEFGNKVINMKNRQIETQLKVLRTQINPHFLFNILNAIYSVNLTNKEQANDLILELSDLLRYQIESNKKDEIPLDQEIESIYNYVNLEKIRVHKLEVNVHKEGDFSEYRIAPLLLIPIVENAFKYGTGISDGKIDISFEMDDGVFKFSCVNKIVNQKEKRKSTGIGLKNVTERLDLLYDGEYIFQTEEFDGIYKVELLLALGDKHKLLIERIKGSLTKSEAV